MEESAGVLRDLQMELIDIDANKYGQWPLYGSTGETHDRTSIRRGRRIFKQDRPYRQGVKEGNGVEQTTYHEGVTERPIKSMAQAVKEMVKETKLGEAKDLRSMIMLSLNDTRDAGDPDWYS
ncbi:MAG: hypothetical protein L6R42_001960 [Xanthoria sp. 1 TBL-2021]|nr:MAG: hypothetical protein L6R42_001960 [Xanthoria sp. 1 TBL-2021]